jgi:hypothetical protein
MLEQFIDLVRENASMLQHPAIPEARKEEAVTIAGSSIYDGIKSILAGGGVTTVMNFFKGDAGSMTTNPLFREVSSLFTKRLSTAFGLDVQQAGAVADSFLPGVLTQLVSKSQDPSNKTFQVQNIFNELSGGQTAKFNIAAMLAKAKSGLDQDGDGDLDFQDLKTLFTRPGGLVDKIKNVFK